MKEIMHAIISAVDFMHACALNHRQFNQLM